MLSAPTRSPPIVIVLITVQVQAANLRIQDGLRETHLTMVLIIFRFTIVRSCQSSCFVQMTEVFPASLKKEKKETNIVHKKIGLLDKGV